MAELPAPLRRALPAEAQRVYRLAYREARGEGIDEDHARATAQEAVEARFGLEHGKWVREDHPSGGPPYGEAAIAALARKSEFPCTSGQLVQRLGDPVVEIAPGQPLPLREVLDLLDQAYWTEPNHLLAAVHGAWPKVRRRWDAQSLVMEGTRPRGNL